MIRSMTGFGAAIGSVGGTQVSVEIRTVNHRFFNPSIKLPSAFSRWEGDVREALRQRIARGHVSVFARSEQFAMNGAVINEDRFAVYVEQLRKLKDKFGLDTLDVGSVLRLPDVVQSSGSESEDGTVEELLAVVVAASDSLSGMREEEGARMAEYLLARLTVFEEAVARIATRAPGRLLEQRDRMRRSVRDLMDGVVPDEQRIAQEIAILADRLDIAEELGRLASHVQAVRASLTDDGAEPVGKRLGFLLQEMLREVNTVGSKGADVEILGDVVLLKEELERLREQIENVE